MIKRVAKYIYWASTLQLAKRVRLERSIARIRESEIFDEDYYLLWNPEVAEGEIDALTHYVFHGAGECRDPHPLFSTHFYREQNPDLDLTSINPLDHFVQVGHAEGRLPHPLVERQMMIASGLTDGEAIPTAMLESACEDHELLLQAEVQRECAYYGFSHLANFVRIGIDSCFPIGEEKVFLSGWILDPDRRIRSLRLRSGVGHSEDIREGARIYPRPDVEEAYCRDLRGRLGEFGFSTLVDLEVPKSTVREHGIRLVGRTFLGESFVMTIPDIDHVDDIVAMSSKLFGEFSLESPGAPTRLAAVSQALQHAIRINHAAHKFENVFVNSYGEPASAPSVSVVVTLYGRFDFMEYQLSQFALDQDFQCNELIYVIDDPRIFEDVRASCEDLYGIFKVPFRIVSAGENQGFAAANNLGVRFATADKIVLLNSDVMPCAPGWLSDLARACDSLEDAGAVAPLLIFGDDTVQGCGVEFEPHPRFTDLWVNKYPLKGLPVGLVNLGDRPRAVPAVTAACMFIDRHRYKELGGLDEQYLLGDFEDSDLCLKFISQGYRNYLVPSVSLYHLERKSQDLFEDVDWKNRVTLFNCWQHSERWGKTIEKLMESRSAPGNAAD
jgi:GT2 family glycosyltransferase